MQRSLGNIMKTLVALLLIGFAAPTIAGAADCPLQGVWKSDAARTLADIAARNALSPRGMTAVSADFFGHMIHEWTCTELRAWFDYHPRQNPVSYQITESTPDSLLVTFPSSDDNDLHLIFEGECYKILFEPQTYHEYFCPAQLP
jgi:hypothetical protein